MPAAPAYHAPASLKETLALLRRLGPAARVVAGGQDIVPLMNQGRLNPGGLIDLKALKALNGVQTRNGSLVIGALTTHRTIERAGSLRAVCGLLAEAAGQIGGGIQVRNRGTIGGSVCAGNPAYDYAPCLVALDAEFRVASLAGERRIAASEFFRDAHVTALEPDELLTEIIVPSSGPNAGVAYEKLKFTDGCYTIASAACAVWLNADDTYGVVRLAVGGVAAVPVRLRQAELRLTGSSLTDDSLADVTALAEEAVDHPLSDVLADGMYRRVMAGVMARRALVLATGRARGQADEGRQAAEGGPS